MMQVVENWTWLTCRLEALRVANGEVELDVWVEDSQPVDDYADLLGQWVRSKVTLRVAADPGPAGPLPAAPLPTVGQRFTIKARLAGPGIVRAERASLALMGS